MKTVFVLGAGASNDFGLPIGSDLKAGIRKIVDFEMRFNKVERGDGNFVFALQKLMRNREFSHDEINEAISLIKSGLMLASSIDSFIDNHRDKPALSKIARMAISLLIQRAEESSRLAQLQLHNNQKLSNLSHVDCWHSNFCINLFDRCTFEELASKLERFKVISFNYDRCFEYYLFHAVRSHYRKSENEVLSALQSFEVLHPYGRLDTSEFPNSAASMSIGQVSDDLISNADYIQTFSQSGYDSERFSIKENFFSGANKVVFLGFGFHDINMEFLRLKSVEMKNLHIISTAMGFSDDDIEDIKHELRGVFPSISMIELHDCDCRDIFYRRSRALSLR